MALQLSAYVCSIYVLHITRIEYETLRWNASWWWRRSFSSSSSSPSGCGVGGFVVVSLCRPQRRAATRRTIRDRKSFERGSNKKSALHVTPFFRGMCVLAPADGAVITRVPRQTVLSSPDRLPPSVANADSDATTIWYARVSLCVDTHYLSAQNALRS